MGQRKKSESPTIIKAMIFRTHDIYFCKGLHQNFGNRYSEVINGNEEEVLICFSSLLQLLSVLGI